MKHRNRFYSTKLIFVLSLLLFSACGGGGGGNGGGKSPSDTTVARVEIAQSKLLLTEPGEAAFLSAQAYNSANEPLDAVFTWTATNPENVAVVMDTGEITSNMPGSSVITASANGVSSGPVLALHAAPVDGAILLRDSQILSGPNAIDPSSTVALGSQFVVTVSGISQPAAGTILVGSDSIPLAGRVVSSQMADADVQVTMEIVSVKDVFANLRVNEVIDLTQAEMIASPVAAQYYSMTKRSDGIYVFDLLPGAVDPISGLFVAPNSPRANPIGIFNAHPVGTRANRGPFSCDFSGPSFNAANGNRIISIAPVGPITINPDTNLIIDFDGGNGGLQRLGLESSAKFSADIKFSLTAALDGKVDCKIELLKPNIPMPGALAFLLSMQVPIGVGVELGGNISLTETNLSLKTDGNAAAKGVLICPNGVCGSIEGSGSATGRIDSSIDVISEIGTGDLASLRFEPTLSGYGYLDISIGPLLFSRAQVNIIETKAGMALKANLSLVEIQINDPSYNSGYALEENAEATLGAGIDNALSLLGMTAFTAPPFSMTTPLASSPAATSIEVDMEAYQPGDVLTFDVVLDPSTLEFIPTVYNIDQVLIYRKTNIGGVIGKELVASTTASVNQSEFNLSWTATDTGTVTDNFFAFVDTVMLTAPLLGGLELGKVNSSQIGGNIMYVAGGNIFNIAAENSRPFNVTINVDTAYKSSSPTWSPNRSKIAFTGSGPNNIRGLYVIDSDGSNMRNLIQTQTGSIYDPKWSPNGGKIVFTGYLDGNYQIYTINSNGTSQNNLTQYDTGAQPSGAVWSPDGTKIAYLSNFGGGSPKIFIMNANGSNQRLLTRLNWGYRNLAWSPNGRKIAFSSNVFQERGVYVIDVSTMVITQLIQTGSMGTKPVWSPDGTKIAFAAGTPEDIYIMVADGSSSIKLTQSEGRDYHPEWSPDGTRIAFFSDRICTACPPGLGLGIYVMNIDGSNIVKLPTNYADDYPGIKWSSR